MQYASGAARKAVLSKNWPRRCAQHTFLMLQGSVLLYEYPEKDKVLRFDSKGESASDFAEKFSGIRRLFDKDFWKVVLE